MNKASILAIAIALSAAGSDTAAQTAVPTPPQAVTREQREQALSKLMEAQRYVWQGSPSRTKTGSAALLKRAESALQEAVVLDPGLAEAYTALAELALTIPPNDVDQAIKLAETSIGIQPDNFGARRILARLFTFKSRLNNGTLDPKFTERAIAEWKYVAKLDPRNAEAWAFLGEFYDRTGKLTEQIEALRMWNSSVVPVEAQFYRRVIGGRSNLSPDEATLKLGGALVKAGKMQEAVEVLSLVVADQPENTEAVELLKDALASADAGTAAAATEALQQAVYSNPENDALITLLAGTQARSGKISEAIKTLETAAGKRFESDKASASALHVAIADIYLNADRFPEAVREYDKALSARGVATGKKFGDDEREFAMFVFEKLIQSHKATNRPDDAKAVIERARAVLGSDDLFADRQLIALHRETGNNEMALAAVRAVRQRFPNDYGFTRTEASILAESGRVDEGVALIKKLIPAKAATARTTETGVISALPLYDDFSNYLFISQLYSQANRGKDAVFAANQAYETAQGSERKQIARLTLATAQQNSGDARSAEATLRAILEQTPGNPIALNNLGYFLLERGERYDEALELIRQAVKIDPTNPSFLDSLGWAYYKLGKLQEAEKYLKDAARIDTASATIREHLGDVYEKLGKPDMSKESWQRALTLATDPSDVTRLKEKLGK